MTSSSLRMGLTILVCITALLSAVVNSKEVPKEAAPSQPTKWRLKPVPQLPIDKASMKRPGPEEAAKVRSQGANPYIIEVTPVNVAVYRGDNVTLTCVAVNDGYHKIQWWEFVYSPGGGIISDGSTIVPSHPEAARYTIIQPTPQTFNLHIQNVKWEDAGTYLCEDVWNGPPTVYRAAAQLIVIDDRPNCTTTLAPNGIVIEGQYYTAECALSYNGDIVPIQTWSGPEPFNVGSSQGPNSIWSGISWFANRTMDTKAFQCLHNFTDNFTPSVEEGSDYVPDWNFTYQTNQMFVYWGPTNMYAEPIKEFYEVGETLTCYADAFPPPSYQWLNTRTNELFYSQGIVINETLVGTTQMMRCQAQNLIQGFVYTNYIFVNVTVLDYTTPVMTTEYPPTTTPVPAVGLCNDLTGRWESTREIKASLCLQVNKTANGHTIGLLRNHTDTFWIEVIGRTQLGNYDQIGFAGIWPGTVGVSGFVGECHNCYGTEVLLINDIQRTKGTDECGLSGPLHYSPQYTFYRSGPTCV